MRASGNDFRSKSRLRALLRQHQPQSASPSLPSEDFVLLTRASSNPFAKLYSDRLLAPHIALPLLKVPMPSVLFPAKNVTVLVAVEGTTLAVNVTIWPSADGFGLEASEVVV